MELVTRNQPGQTMFVIQNGSCQRKMGASGLGQRRRRRQFLHEGGSFGELAALGLEQRYSHSVVATERCDLYLLAGDDLRAAIGDEANVLAVRVDATNPDSWWYDGGGLYRKARVTVRSRVPVREF